MLSSFDDFDKIIEKWNLLSTVNRIVPWFEFFGSKQYYVKTKALYCYSFRSDRVTTSDTGNLLSLTSAKIAYGANFDWAENAMQHKVSRLQKHHNYFLMN